VTILDPHGVILSRFGEKGSDPGNFDSPMGCCVATETVATATQESKVDSTTLPSLVHASRSVTVNNVILVADSMNNRVQVFDLQGNLQRVIGTQGSGKGQLEYPVGVAVDSDNVAYVADSDNGRISVFELDGTFIRTIETQHGDMSPWGVDTTCQGDIIVTDGANMKVQVFSGPTAATTVTGSSEERKQSVTAVFGSEGTQDDQFGVGPNVCTSLDDFIIISDQGNNRIKVFDAHGKLQSAFGARGTELGQFRCPSSVAIAKQSGDLFVPDSSGDRIQRISGWH
jgi:DNA-binding beta-propeller fold protein YncE